MALTTVPGMGDGVGDAVDVRDAVAVGGTSVAVGQVPPGQGVLVLVEVAVACGVTVATGP